VMPRHGSPRAWPELLRSPGYLGGCLLISASLPLLAAGPLGSGGQLTSSPGRAVADEVAERPLVAVIDTIAGGGSVGDGGPATAARFNLPGGVVEAPNGDLIVVDFGNHRVRAIDHETGIIRTIAGTGEAGYNGDGIPAERAQLSRPEYAVFGADGELYIADSYNNRIRRLDLETGLIATVAGNGERGIGGDGGAAVEASLHFPEGIAVDAAGNLFIGDTVNRKVRRVDAETGVITTYAGTGEVGINPEGTPAAKARFLRLARLAVGPDGDLFIADSPSQTIIRIDAETRTLHTFAGTGERGYSGDGGAATEARVSFPEGVIVAADGSVYFADVGNHRVRRVDGETGIITTVAGTGERGFSGDGGAATEARLWSPGRLWLDRRGGLLIADILNSRIRRVDGETGIITTIAGTGEWGDDGPASQAVLSVPGDVAYAAGKLYIADYGTRRVRCVDLASGIITTVAGGGLGRGEGLAATDVELLLPEGIAVDGERAIYIADNLSSRIWRVDLESGRLYTLAGSGRPGNSGDGGPAAEAQLYLPAAVSVHADGTIFISDFGNRTVRTVDPESGVIDTLRSGTGADAPPLGAGVISLVATPRGLFHIVQGHRELQLWDARTGQVQPLALPGELLGIDETDSQVVDLAIHGASVYLVDALAHRLLRLDLGSGTVEVVAGSGKQGFSGDGGPAAEASLFQPGSVAVSDDGSQIFIADTKNHRVRRVRFLPLAEAR